jgi:hypothetical protein
MIQIVDGRRLNGYRFGSVIFRAAVETGITSKAAGPFQSHPRWQAKQPPSGGSERGESFREDGRRKHRVSEANKARSEALDRSDSGLSGCY